MNNLADFYMQDNKNLLKDMGIYNQGFEVEMISTFTDTLKSPTDAIEIIVDMAKTGRIDPWNIDIVKVYDEYMKKLAELNAQNNLKFVGRAFLFASILLNLKSKVLNGLSLADFEPSYDDNDIYENDMVFEEEVKTSFTNVISFDEVLQRRTSTKLNHTRAITLNDLIRHLEFYEEIERKRAIKNTLMRKEKRGKNYSKLTTNDILDMTQDEYIEELVDKMDQNLTKILEKEEKIELSELRVIGFSKPAAYIAVLFLCSRGKYDIEQKEFYGDLFVKLPKEITNAG
ncbi:MAG: segregation/condensation protein A [Candidatus Gastranaerophilales bacterium]|nr:segregation/condensation protein A [Candidatus Gastranaerophilales bacterium]